MVRKISLTTLNNFKNLKQFCFNIQSKMSTHDISSVMMDEGGAGVVEDLRLKIARQEKAKQTEALAERLVAAVQALDVKAAQEALASLRQGKLDKLEVAELLVGRMSLKEWRKLRWSRWRNCEAETVN